MTRIQTSRTDTRWRFWMRFLSFMVEIASIAVFVLWAKRHCVTENNHWLYAGLFVGIAADLFEIFTIFPRKNLSGNGPQYSSRSRFLTNWLVLLDLAVLPMVCVGAINGIMWAQNAHYNARGEIVTTPNRDPAIKPRMVCQDRSTLLYLPVILAAIFAHFHLAFIVMLCCFSTRIKKQPAITEPELIETTIVHPSKKTYATDQQHPTDTHDPRPITNVYGQGPPLRDPLEHMPDVSPGVNQKLKRNDRWWLVFQGI